MLIVASPACRPWGTLHPVRVKLPRPAMMKMLQGWSCLTKSWAGKKKVWCCWGACVATSGRQGSSEGKRHCSGGKVPQGLHERTRCEIDVHNDDLFSAGAAVPRTNSRQESSAHAASAFAGIEVHS